MQNDDSKMLNKPESDIPQKPFTIEHIENHNSRTNKDRLNEIEKEFRDGFDFIKKYQKSVSFYGSARFKEGNAHYKMAYNLSRRLVEELGVAVVTGGGPGIMEAANRGAFEAKGQSIGFNIQLPHEQISNPYQTASMSFYYFFVRKVMLCFSAEAYFFFPGGFGTLDEFFELANLVQTNKIPRIPIILVGKDYWEPLRGFLKKTVFQDHKAIDEEDFNMFTITENEQEILDIVRKAPMRKQ